MLTKAGEAKSKNAYSKAKEQVLIVMNEYKIDYQIGNIKDDDSIANWLENQKNNIKSIDDFTFDKESKIIGLKKDGYTFFFNSDGSPAAVYNIEYKLNGGTNEENAVSSYTKGQTVHLPIPTKEGAEFLGWSTKSDNNDSENIISAITGDMEGDIKLYAYWLAETSKDYFDFTPNSDGTTATITGFSALGNQKYEAGEITDLVLPSKDKERRAVTVLKDGAFLGREGITRLIIPDSVEKIGTGDGNAFGSCTGIKYLKIPISTSIYSVKSGKNNSSFTGVSNIEELYISKGNGVGIDYAWNTFNLTPWNISKDKLTKLTMEKGITSIGNNAFNGCNKITELYYTGTLSEWNEITIGSNNESITRLTVQWAN